MSAIRKRVEAVAGLLDGALVQRKWECWHWLA